MSDPIVLGEAADGPLTLDPDALVGAHTCVIANAGAGKSGLIRVLLERIYGRIQIIVLDAEDEFYTLREMHPFMLVGGEGGDTPLTPDTDGAALATLLLTHGMSAVVQMNSLRASEQERFVAQFVTALMEAPAELQHPVLIVLDEAHRFAPQDGYAESAEPVRDLTARGRKRGFTAVLATQRLAKIDKNVTGDVNNWLLGRVGQDTDRRRAADALGFSPSSQQGRALQTLPTRTFWGFGVALSPTPQLFTVAKAETTIIKAGQAKVPTPPAPEEFAALLAGLVHKPEPEIPVDAKPDSAPVLGSAKWADDNPFEAERLRIREDSFAEGVAAGDQEGHQRGYREGREVGYSLGISWAAAAMREAIDDMLTSPGETRDPPAEPSREPPPDAQEPPAPPAEPSHPPPPPPAPPPAGERRVDTARVALEAAGSGVQSIPTAGRAMLDAMASLRPARLTWAQIATASGRKPKGGSFGAAKTYLLKNALVAEDGDYVSLTEKGTALYPPPEDASPLGLWLAAIAKQPKPAEEMLRSLVDDGPATPQELGDRLNRKPSGGQWGAGISTLRRNKLIEEVAGRLCIQRWLLE